MQTILRAGPKTGVFATLSAAFVANFVEWGRKTGDIDKGWRQRWPTKWSLGQALRRQGRKWALLALVALWQFTGNAADSTFVNVTETVGLPPDGYGAVSWGDYDNDGRPDLLIGSQ